MANDDDGSAALKRAAELRTERDGDTEKGCQKPVVQQKTTDDLWDGPVSRPPTANVILD